MHRLVIDTDPGVDDAHAIMLACAHPAATVEALTTVAGNVSLDAATRNALIVLDAIGHPAPVYAGCDDALVVPTPRRATSHGRDGLGDAGYPPASRRAETEHAALALIRLADEAPGALTLIALGPLTNIALATRLDPALPQKYARLVVMGGAIHAIGNSWERAAEFNTWCDPEAAAVVFTRWPMLTLLPWETAAAHALTRDEAELVGQGDSARAALFRRTSRNRPAAGGIQYEADALAVAAVLEPDIVTRAAGHYVEIELAGRFTRGQTVIDWYGLTGRAPNARVVLDVDHARFVELLGHAG